MTFFDSSISRFHISDTVGTSHDVSASITKIHGIPGSRSLIDITALTDHAHTYVVGPPDSAITLTGIFDDDTDTVLGALFTEDHPSPTEFIYAPAGTTPGSARYTGQCWIERYAVSSTATLKVQGTITRDLHRSPTT